MTTRAFDNIPDATILRGAALLRMTASAVSLVVRFVPLHEPMVREAATEVLIKDATRIADALRAVVVERATRAIEEREGRGGGLDS